MVVSGVCYGAARMVVVASLVGMALLVVVATFGWGWRRGTLLETDQERIDREFDRIVGRLDI